MCAGSPRKKKSANKRARSSLCAETKKNDAPPGRRARRRVRPARLRQVDGLCRPAGRPDRGGREPDNDGGRGGRAAAESGRARRCVWSGPSLSFAQPPQTRNGALSYFIGTQCLKLAGSPEDQYVVAGGSFYEYGFALNNYNPGTGYVAPTVWDPASFLYRLRLENCLAPIAMGPMCFTANGAQAGSGPCVDKTFAFNRDSDGAVMITTPRHDHGPPPRSRSTRSIGGRDTCAEMN